ncbi:MAG: cob(I)yrinic acid a,c-diamide adenosyltransferase [Spirochaetales bacterium]|nr:cob(I)yrinic acid a,c-diamide adenosyltransferase [Spirochaetales bacterium]
MSDKQKAKNIDKKTLEQSSSDTKAGSSRGIILVITGKGKGKSTSGFGVITRSVGHGYKAAVSQFIKGKWDCGERNLLEEKGVPFSVMATGFTWNSKDREGDIAAAKKVWEESKRYLSDSSIHVVLLDELTYMLEYKYLDREDVFRAIAERPTEQSVVITGRGADSELIEMADTVSEIQDIKHAFREGVKARKGIDW